MKQIDKRDNFSGLQQEIEMFGCAVKTSCNYGGYVNSLRVKLKIVMIRCHVVTIKACWPSNVIEIVLPNTFPCTELQPQGRSQDFFRGTHKSLCTLLPKPQKPKKNFLDYRFSNVVSPKSFFFCISNNILATYEIFCRCLGELTDVRQSSIIQLLPFLETDIWVERKKSLLF